MRMWLRHVVRWPEGRQFYSQDANGQQVGLADFNDNRVVVLFFMGTHCPIADLDLK